MSKKPDVTATSLGNKRLWNTYMYWARAATAVPIDSSLDISDPRKRITEERSAALRTIVFAALLLEYRLKATYEFADVTYDHRLTLGPLLAGFKKGIESGYRHDNKKPIRLSSEWPSILRRLKSLVTLRNRVVHAKYAEVRKMIRSRPEVLTARARRCYNAVVDAMRLVNAAIGYEPLGNFDARAHYARLKVPER